MQGQKRPLAEDAEPDPRPTKKALGQVLVSYSSDKEEGLDAEQGAERNSERGSEQQQEQENEEVEEEEETWNGLESEEQEEAAGPVAGIRPPGVDDSFDSVWPCVEFP